MRERIILTSNVNESESLRTLAKYSADTFGTRILNPVDLAKYALNKSGIAITEKFLPRAEEAFAIFPILKELNYFSEITLDDAYDIVNTIREIRNLNSNIKLEEPIFEAINAYLDWQKINNIINSEGIVKKAINESLPMDAEFVCLKEFPLKPLEEKLLLHLSNGEIKELNFSSLTQLQSEANDTIKYVKAYGASNEVDFVISQIYKNKIPLDKYLIACTNIKIYSQLIFDICKSYNVPVTFSCGIPIGNSHPAALLKLLNNWNSFGQNGCDSLRTIITSASFNQNLLKEILQVDVLSQDIIEGIVKIMGNLRISFNAKTNTERLNAYEKLINKQLVEASVKQGRDGSWLKKDFEFFQMTKIFSDEFMHGPLYFIDKFSNIRNGADQKIDIAAKTKIIESILTFNKYFPKKSISEIIPNILQTNICQEISCEGALHVSDISSAISSMRENIFIIGMQANDFPGKPSENYLICDDRLKSLSDSKTLPTSDNKIQEKKKSFFSLVNTAQNMGSKICISFAGNDLVEIKEQNPSSVLFELFEQSHPNTKVDDFNEQVLNLQYFENDISLSNKIGEAYSQNKQIESKLDFRFSPKNIDEKIKNKKWSPSAIECFFNCPRQFYLKYIEGIQDIGTDNPYEVINAMVLGNLAHKLMESLTNNNLSEDEFLKLADNLFEEHLISRPPIDARDAKREKQNFINMMKIAYKQDPHNKVEAIEKWVGATHSTGLIIGGYLDRLENIDGTNTIIDFKTKKKVEHVQNDIDSCMQIALYLWLCEQNNIDVSAGEYRYLRFGTSVTCNYNDEIKNQLDEKITQFADALKSCEFPPAEKNDACTYCNLASICNWKQSEDDE